MVHVEASDRDELSPKRNIEGEHRDVLQADSEAEPNQTPFLEARLRQLTTARSAIETTNSETSSTSFFEVSLIPIDESEYFCCNFQQLKSPWNPIVL